MIQAKILHELIRASAGFTLLEAAVAISVLTMGIGLVGSGVFQVLYTQQFGQGDLKATKDLRHVGSWFGGDALNTETTDLVDGASPVNSVTLTTFNGEEITYSHDVLDSVLLRTFDDGVTSTESTLASNVVSAEFSLNAEVLKLELEVEAETGGTKAISLESKLR